MDTLRKLFQITSAVQEAEDVDYIMTRTSRPRRQIARTLVMERVRNAIEENRVARSRRLGRIVSSTDEVTVENSDYFYVGVFHVQ